MLGVLAALSLLLLCLAFSRNGNRLNLSHEERRNILYSTTSNVYPSPKCFSCSRRISPSRFVIGLNYWEQTNMALGNMFALNRLAYDWSASLVWPFTLNSRLYGLPHLRADHKWRIVASRNETMLSLDHLFNINYLNLLGNTYNLSKLIDFRNFLEESNRLVTIMHFIHRTSSRERSILPASPELHHQLAKDAIFECINYPSIQTIAHDIMSALNIDASYRPFRLHRYCCVNASKETTPTQLAEKCGFGPSNVNFSLLVLNWRGLGDTHIVKNSAKGLHKSQRSIITNLTLREHPKGGRDIFKHSSEVLGNASYFLRKLKLSYNKFIGIHIRSEKLGQRSARISKFASTCLRKALRVSNNFQQFENYSTVLLTDYGAHGSDSCLACKGSRKIQQILRIHNIHPIHFDPFDYKSSDDSGFIAAVEMEVLIKARYIILVGGGAFQRQIAMQKHRLGSYKTRNSVIKVCWEDNINMKFYSSTI